MWLVVSRSLQPPSPLISLSYTIPFHVSCNHSVFVFLTASSRGELYCSYSCPGRPSLFGPAPGVCRLARRRLSFWRRAGCVVACLRCAVVLLLGSSWVGRMFGACCHLLAQGTRHSDFCTSEDLNIIVRGEVRQKRDQLPLRIRYTWCIFTKRGSGAGNRPATCPGL